MSFTKPSAPKGLSEAWAVLRNPGCPESQARCPSQPGGPHSRDCSGHGWCKWAEAPGSKRRPGGRVGSCGGTVWEGALVQGPEIQ